MSLRLEMLQVARLAPKTLGDAANSVRSFVLSQRNADGGFCDRTGRSDLYYTVFGLDCLLALQADEELHVSQEFLESFGAGERLDFVHLCCLARGWASLRHACRNPKIAESTDANLRARLGFFRAKDGGFHPSGSSAEFGTAYGAFLGTGALQDLKSEIPDSARLTASLGLLRAEDGGWANERIVVAGMGGGSRILSGATNSTAAVVAVLRNLRHPVDAAAGRWLLSCYHNSGGFLAMPQAPLPDLLSTATALHALSGLQVPFDGLRERALDFIDSLWVNTGSFHAHWAEDMLDVEYTYYGLLALGHLAE